VLASSLLAGDLLLTSNQSLWYCSAIQDVTASPWSHAAMVVSDLQGGWYVAEMTSPKCRITPIREWLESSGRAWACRVRRTLSPAQVWAVWNYWQRLEGKSYGYAVLATMAVTETWQRFSTWLGLPVKWRRIPAPQFGKVCSTAVAEAWRVAGLPSADVAGESPVDCSREIFVGPVEEVAW
jgi:hypothetical protein